MEQTPKPAEAPKPRSKTMWIVAAVIIVIVVIAGVYYAFFMGTATNVAILDDGACASGATGCKFDPTPFATTAGKTVVWKNNGGVPHTVESCDTSSSYASNTAACPNGANTGAAASVRFVSSSIAAGGTFSAPFSTAGTYNYFCNIHLWMHGTVTVS